MKSFRYWIVALVLVASLVYSNTSPLYASTTGPDKDGVYRPTIYINDEKQNIKGFIMPSGTTLVPFRILFDTLKIEANFDNKTKTLTAVSDNTTLKLTAGQMFGIINDEKVSLIQSPFIGGDDIFQVNLRFIAEAYGAVVGFDKATLSIYINFPENN